MEALFGRQTLLIHGYAREISDEEEIFVPLDIIRILLQFFNQIMIWRIDEKNWNDVLNTKTGQAYYSEIFEVNSIKFRCSLCPDGWKRSQKGKVQYFLETVHIPDNIGSVTVFYQLFCLQTQTNWKSLRKFTGNKQASSWYSSTLTKREIEQIADKSLDLYCYVDTLHIEYVRDKRDYVKLAEMRVRAQYKWNLTRFVLEQCLKAREKQAFCSPSFGGHIDGNWCMAFLPRTHCIELRLLRLPTGLKSIDAHCKIVCYSKTLDYLIVDADLTLDYETKKARVFKIYNELDYDQLSFKCDILVKGGRKWNGKYVRISTGRDWIKIR